MCEFFLLYFFLPFFVSKLQSLERLDLSYNYDAPLDASLDFLSRGCPRLREVRLTGVHRGPRAPVEAFAARLLAGKPNVKVVY